MRAARLLGLFAAFALLASLILGATAYLSWRRAMAMKIDRALEMERQVTLPGAAARLAAGLLQGRLAEVSEAESRAVAAAFGHVDAAQALADYRAAGGDPGIAAEAERALVRQKTPTANADIALMRAIRGLRGEAARMPRASRPLPPPAFGGAATWLLWAAAAALAASGLAYFAGRARER